jgi:hypothetical protein
MVLPPRGAPGIARKPREGESHDPGIATLDRDVPTRAVNEIHVLVKPDADRWAKTTHEVVSEPALRFRKRLRTRVEQAPGRTYRLPSPREVSVEINAPGILPRSLGSSVGVQIGDDHKSRGTHRTIRYQIAGHWDAGAFVSVDAADHQDPPRPRSAAHPFGHQPAAVNRAPRKDPVSSPHRNRTINRGWFGRRDRSLHRACLVKRCNAGAGHQQHAGACQ